MTPEQRGAFIQLLCDAWADPSEPCTLPDDDAELAILSGLGERWETAGAKVRAQFEPTESGRLRNPKQWTVYTGLVEYRSKQSEAGKAGMRARWGAKDNGEPAPEANDHSADFLRAWELYPKRFGGNAKKPAHKAWVARLREGVSEDELIIATTNYAAHIRATGKDSTEYVMQAATFYGPNERWRDYLEAPAHGGGTSPSVERWELYKKHELTTLEGGDYTARIAEAVKAGVWPTEEDAKRELQAVRPWDIAAKARSTQWAAEEVAKRLRAVAS